MLKRLRLFIVIFLVIVLSISLFAGCVKKESATGEQESTAGGTETNGEVQSGTIKPYASDKKVELSWLMRDDEQSPLNINGKFFDELEKLTGVRVKAIPVLPNALQDRLNLAVAGNTLPDIVQGAEDDPTFLLSYGEKGAFIPLNDLIDKYAPNIKEHMNDPQYTEAKYWSSALNGKQYVIPRFRPEPDFDKHFMIRQDWLEKLNLKMPNNVDEFYNVLKTFKEKDPAGDGKTIPLSSVGGLSIQQFFVLFDVKDDFFIENGEVKYGPVDPRYKQSLEWLNRFYKEGLLHQEVVSLSEDQYYEDVYGGNVGVGYNSLGRLTKSNDAFNKKFPDKGYKFTLLIPMESITGQRRAHVELALLQPIAISSNCKYPEVAIKLLDFFFSLEATRLAEWGLSSWEGIEGAGAFEKVSDISQVPSEYIESKEKFGTKDAIFIIPPTMEDFRLRANRAIVVDWKAFPFKDSAIIEWRDRIFDVTNNQENNLIFQGFSSYPQLEKSYTLLNESYFLYLCEKYNVEYMVITTERELKFTELYSNNRYRVYRI